MNLADLSDPTKIIAYVVIAIFWGFSAWREKKRKEALEEARARQRASAPTEIAAPQPSRIEPSPFEMETDEEVFDETETEDIAVASEHILTETMPPNPPLKTEGGRLTSWVERAHNHTTIYKAKETKLPINLFPTGASQAFIASEILSKPRALRRLK